MSGQIKSIKHCLQISKTEINEEIHVGSQIRARGSPMQLIPFHAIPIKVPPGFFLFYSFFSLLFDRTQQSDSEIQ